MILILITLSILFFISIALVLGLSVNQHRDLVKYELGVLLRGNGEILRQGNYKGFSELMTIQNSEFRIGIRDTVGEGQFSFGNEQLEASGVCASEDYYQYNVSLCRPSLMPWGSLLLIGIVFIIVVGIIVISFLKLGSSLLSSLREIFILAQIPHPAVLDLNRAWEIAHGMAERFKRFQDQVVQNTRNEAIARISEQVAHDIRSPLSALTLMISASREMPEEQRHLVKMVQDRIQGIANDLLMKSKPRKGKYTDVEQVVASIVAEKRYQTKILDFQSDCSGPVVVEMDATTLGRVLSNLINNALDACEVKGRVQVRIEASNETVQVTIEDSGSGIPQQILERLGKEQVSSKGDRGNGIGFWAANRDVESMGGSLVVKSQEGQGTKVTLTLPRVLP